MSVLELSITEKTDEDILAIANPFWDNLIECSNSKKYGEFTKNFSYDMKLNANVMEMGKQFARSKLTENLSIDRDFLGVIRRGKHVTVLFRQRNEKMLGEWLGRLVLGYEEDEVKIFGATIF